MRYLIFIFLLLIFQTNSVHAQSEFSVDIKGISGEYNQLDNYYWFDGKALNIVDLYYSFSGYDVFVPNGTLVSRKIMGDLFIIVNDQIDKVRELRYENNTLITSIILTEGRNMVSMVYTGLSIVYDTVIIYVNDRPNFNPSMVRNNIEFIDNTDDRVISQKLAYQTNSGLTQKHNFDSNITAAIVFEDGLAGIIEYNSYGSLSLQYADSYSSQAGFILIRDSVSIHAVNRDIYYIEEISFDVLVFHKSGILLAVDTVTDYENMDSYFDNIEGSLDYTINLFSIELDENGVDLTSTQSEGLNSDIDYQSSGSFDATYKSSLILPMILIILMRRHKR